MIGRILIWITALLLLGIGLLIGLYFWRNHTIARQSRLALERVQQALEAKQPREALAMINSRPPTPASDVNAQTEWLRAEIEASARLSLISRLQTLHRQSPHEFLANEKASLILARSLVHADNPIAAAKIRDAWVGQTERPQLWLAQEIDALLLEGRRKEALERLQTTSLPGAADSGRLTRLAFLSSTNLAQSWELLAEAYERNPRDPDVRSFRGQILETLGSNRLARVEYVAAHLVAPDNIFLRDQLAEFYRRQGSHLNALQTWLPAFTNSPPEFVRLKTMFWLKTVRRLAPAAPSSVNQLDPLAPLTRFVAALPEDRFWDPDAFSLVTDHATFARERQEVFWLRLLELLRRQEHSEAFELMRTSPFMKRAFDPALFTSLYRILNFREMGRLNPPEIDLPALRNVAQRHVFLRALDQRARQEAADTRPDLPAEFAGLIRDDAAPALAFLAAGWLEAGLAILPERKWTDPHPEWIPYTITQALRLTRGTRSALEFAKKQPVTPGVQLLVGELQLSLGESEGTQRLTGIATHDSPAGYRAAWLLSVAALDARRFDAARQHVRNQARLHTNTVGSELLAKIELAQGQTNKAEKIYHRIVKDSTEAKAFLARQAYARRDFARARELTGQLLQELPSDLQLRENLRAIETAAQEAARSPAR